MAKTENFFEMLAVLISRYSQYKNNIFNTKNQNFRERKKFRICGNGIPSH